MVLFGVDNNDYMSDLIKGLLYLGALAALFVLFFWLIFAIFPFWLAVVLTILLLR